MVSTVNYTCGTLLLLSVIISGCATGIGDPGNHESSAWNNNRPNNTSHTDEFHSTHNSDNSPEVIIPVNGDSPVIGIPIGGGVYIPATGGEPTIGTPVSP